MCDTILLQGFTQAFKTLAHVYIAFNMANTNRYDASRIVSLHINLEDCPCATIRLAIWHAGSLTDIQAVLLTCKTCQKNAKDMQKALWLTLSTSMPSGPSICASTLNRASMSSAKASGLGHSCLLLNSSIWCAARRPFPAEIMCRKDMKCLRTRGVNSSARPKSNRTSCS